jgi:type II secretory pathway component PulK
MRRLSHEPPPVPGRCGENGSLLIIVLWIAFGLVAVALYFAHSMHQELRAADHRTAAVAAQQAIAGAARYLSNYLGTVAYPGEMPTPEYLPGEAVPIGEAQYWLIGRDTNDWELNLTRAVPGLVDETARLNLNAPWLTADMIQYLPGMTPQIAAAIMDWRDADSSLTSNGAEDETYSRANTPYKTKNAAFESVEELRLVNYVTPEILYGEDANLNGILDANENDGDASAPYDNRDGRLDPGLMEYFTVYSYEPMTGTNINNQAEVRALLQTILGTQRATEIGNNLFATGGQGGGQGGGNQQSLTSILQFFIRGNLTADEAAQVYPYLAPTTNIMVNVNTASQAVLECIPGIGTDYAATLITYRESNPSALTSIEWVATAMNNDASAIQAGPYLTTRTYQYTADIAAVGPHHRGYQRVRYVFDTSEGTPQIVRRQDLTHLGWALGKDTRADLLAWAKEKGATP